MTAIAGRSDRTSRIPSSESMVCRMSGSAETGKIPTVSRRVRMSRWTGFVRTQMYLPPWRRTETSGTVPSWRRCTFEETAMAPSFPEKATKGCSIATGSGRYGGR